MTEREEIDMLRRLVADLTERVRALEARPVLPTVAAPTGAAPLPTWPNGWPVKLQPTFSDPPGLRPVTACLGIVPHDGVTVQSWG